MIDTLDAGLLHEFFDYFPETGKVITKSRAAKYFKLARLHKAFNTKYAGEEAGFIDPDGYRIIMLFGRNYPAHRIAYALMTGKWPDHQIDHENHVRSDNRWDNIKPVTHQENGKNIVMRSSNKTGVTGVCWNASSCQWRAYIMNGRKQKALGMHKDFFDAVCVRKSAEVSLKYHRNHGQKSQITYRYKGRKNGEISANHQIGG